MISSRVITLIRHREETAMQTNWGQNCASAVTDRCRRVDADGRHVHCGCVCAYCDDEELADNAIDRFPTYDHECEEEG
jgi:hypothetical protein